jgi:N-acetylglucosaminyl-diphospho-decaprenol L-rhamnosyltransferase
VGESSGAPVPTLSVIIVSWNVRDLLRACLSSVLRARDEGLELEVIVVDNVSADGSVEMVRCEFPQVRVIANSENRGFTGGNNQGMAASGARYLMLLNPDTEVRGGALQTLVAYLEAHAAVGAVGPQLLNPDGSVQSSRRRFPTLAVAFFESTWLQSRMPRGLLRRYYVQDHGDDETLAVDWVTGAALILRRTVYEQVGGLDEGFFMYSEELDWCRRIKAAGWQVVYLPAAQVVHYEGKSSDQALPARHINFQSSKIRYFRKYHGRTAAAALRMYLLASYAQQLVLEWLKGLVGSKPELRRQRVQAYRQVLRSGLR